MKKKVKKLVKGFDNKLFKGKLKRTYKKLTGKDGFFKGKDSVVINEPVSDMILMQYNKNDYFQYQFYDIPVRVLAIENYYEKNDFGFELYRKMHTVGGNYGQTNLTEQYYKDARKKNKTAVYGKVREEHSIEQFKELIRSYEKNGYREDSVVMADRNLLSMNGSHRIAMAIARGQEFINSEVHNRDFERRFSIDWFWKNGFEREEIRAITDKMAEIKADAKKAIGDYYCILFPPAVDYFDDITKDLGAVDPDNIRVTGYQDYQMDQGKFIGLMNTIYSFDSILKHNLERKLFYILRSSTPVNGMLPVRIVSISIENPMYRLKKDNGMPESVATVRLKDAIRGRYKVKDKKFTTHYVGDYAHDVIIHSTDNFLSNNAMRYLMELDTDLSELFAALGRFDYTVVESGVDKVSPVFPHDFYLNDDLDIFVTEDQLDEISAFTEEFLKKKYQGPWIVVENIESQYGRRVRLMMRDTLLVMFDYIVKMPHLRSSFIETVAKGSAEKDGFRRISIDDELSVRLAKYRAAANKTWHADFIRAHREQFHFDENAFTDPAEMKRFYQENFAK